MKLRIALLLVAGMTLAACQGEKGVGFTGIGKVSSRALQPGYALGFDGLAPVVPEAGRTE
ncbi:hypothetical protein [Seohaeicola zhoushanensis]|uniref:Lipoprotein n=1 Tax=Seohaeicola zhoushanensis TaxID=1569283 RepID=A0A8J3M3Y8_9RHOB|nr:hypothetical protein [Seohaeicola zhoushanensis]GHF32805.1 hypothetical protein GCM10017056_00210 [Seohaeicola zhoushanensis]